MDEPLYNSPKKKGELLTIVVDPEFGEPCMFVKVMYFSVFNCLCCDMDISTYMSEYQKLEEIDPELNEEKDIRMDEIRDDHWRYIYEEDKDKKNIHALRWELINIYILVSVPHPKGGNIVCTCVKDHTIDENEQYEDIGLSGFDYKLFEEEECGNNREVLYNYPYLKHLIQLWYNK